MDFFELSVNDQLMYTIHYFSTIQMTVRRRNPNSKIQVQKKICNKIENLVTIHTIAQRCQENADFLVATSSHAITIVQEGAK